MYILAYILIHIYVYIYLQIYYSYNVCYNSFNCCTEYIETNRTCERKNVRAY